MAGRAKYQHHSRETKNAWEPQATRGATGRALHGVIAVPNLDGPLRVRSAALLGDPEDWAAASSIFGTSVIAASTALGWEMSSVTSTSVLVWNPASRGDWRRQGEEAGSARNTRLPAEKKVLGIRPACGIAFAFDGDRPARPAQQRCCSMSLAARMSASA